MFIMLTVQGGSKYESTTVVRQMEYILVVWFITLHKIALKPKMISVDGSILVAGM